MRSGSLNIKFLRQNKQSGLTLIEVMLYTALFSLISVSFISLLLMIASFESRFRSTAEIERNRSQLIDELYALTESGAYFIVPAAGTSSSSLVMIDRADREIIIGLDANRLYINQNGVQNWLTGPTLIASQLLFTGVTGNAVRMSLSLGSLNRSEITIEPDRIDTTFTLQP